MGVGGAEGERECMCTHRAPSFEKKMIFFIFFIILLSFIFYLFVYIFIYSLYLFVYILSLHINKYWCTAHLIPRTL